MASARGPSARLLGDGSGIRGTVADDHEHLIASLVEGLGGAEEGAELSVHELERRPKSGGKTLDPSDTVAVRLGYGILATSGCCVAATVGDGHIDDGHRLPTTSTTFTMSLASASGHPSSSL